VPFFLFLFLCDLDLSLSAKRLFGSYLVLLQGANVKVSAGDNTTTADPSDRLAVSRAYPHTFGQPLVHLMPVASPEAKSAKHSPLRYLNVVRSHPPVMHSVMQWPSSISVYY